jgi:hypothetical protein
MFSFFSNIKKSIAVFPLMLIHFYTNTHPNTALSVTKRFAECVRHLGVSRFPDGVFVDGTFGRGGHTRKVIDFLKKPLVFHHIS